MVDETHEFKSGAPPVRWRAASLVPVLLGALAARVAAMDLLFTAETGYTPLPCDCPVERLGGWAQRAALLDSLRADTAGATLTLEGGGWLTGIDDPAAVALALQSLNLMGYDAVNVGAPDLDPLRRMQGQLADPPPLVCGHPDRPDAIPALRILERSGNRVAVIGAGWFGADLPSPAEQVARALEGAPAVDFVVVLLSGGLGPADAIASAHSEVDVVIYGEGAKTPQPVELDGAWGVAPGTRGRYVGRLALDGNGNGPGCEQAPPAALRLVPVRAQLTGPDTLHLLALRAAAARAGGSAAFLRDRFSYRE